MTGSELCELHEAALFSRPEESEALLRLARSPIGDECQLCPVCRSAREYVGRLLAERTGETLPAGHDSQAAWKELQTSIGKVKSTVHPSP